MASGAVAQPAAAGREQAGDVVEVIDPTPRDGAQREADDVVEVVDDGTVPVAAPPRPTLDTTRGGERFELHGWARQSVEVGLSSGGYRMDDPSPTAVPYDRLIGRTQLFSRARYSRGRRFEADISGYFNYSLSEQGPARKGVAFNGFNGQSTRGTYEAGVYELFVALFYGPLDLRLGQQRVAWGRGDFFSPNDVVNARDNRDPFSSEPELRFVPTLLMRAGYDLDFGSLEAVVSPFYVPDRGDVLGSNWAGVQPDAPVVLRVLANTPQAGGALAVAAPDANWTAPQGGLRFAWSRGGWDMSHYYHFGFDGPLITMSPGVAEQLPSSDLREVGRDDVSVLTEAVRAGGAPFVASFPRRHHLGADAGTTFGPFGVRVDAAYQSTRTFYRRDLLGFASPTLLGVASIEYQTGERDKGVIVECLYVHTFHRSAVPLLSYERDTLGVAGLVRWELLRPMSVDVRVVWGIRPEMVLLQPSLSARLDALTLSAGGLWLAGAEGSLADYFHRNRQLLFKAKYAF